MRDNGFTEEWLADRLARQAGTKAKNFSNGAGKDTSRAEAASDKLDASPSKYRNRKTEVDGIVFASKKEANRYGELKLMQSQGLIRNLKTQVPFTFTHNDVVICRYYADFMYDKRLSGGGIDLDVPVVEDVKGGKRTKEYIIKRKLMKAFYAIEILET